MISIIIPTLNEEEGIAKVICSIPEKIRKKSEVIVVDVSDDMTPLIAERLGAKVIRAGKKGKGRQMRLAAKEAKGDILVFLDGGGEDPAQYIPDLIKELKHANLVLGSHTDKRFKEDDKMMRETYKLYQFFVVPLFRLIDLKIADPLAGFRAIRRKDWDRLNLESNDFEIEIEMNIKAMKQGFTIKEVPIPYLTRGGGLRNSKFIFNPKEWFKVSKVSLKYLKDGKLKSKLRNFESKIKSKIKF